MEIVFTTEQIEELFCKWLRGENTVLNLGDFQTALAESLAVMPDDLCQELDYPEGTTIGHVCRCQIGVSVDGSDYRVDTQLSFPNEHESLMWWRQHKDNPDRIKFENCGENKWRVSVAGVEPVDFEKACDLYAEWAESQGLVTEMPSEGRSELRGSTWHLENVRGLLATVDAEGVVRPVHDRE